ncbi:MAG TPA: thioredoxin family protein [Paludibacter sp.]
MNKIIKYLAFLFLLVDAQIALSQSTIKFSESGLNLALNKAKSENKPVFLMCYTTWCPHCKYMKSEVFIDHVIAEFYNKTFICVAQDMEKGNCIKLMDSLKITSFPTFIYYDPNGTMVYRVEGEFKPAVFVEEGKNALTPKKQLPFLKQQFEKDVSNSNNCYVYLRALKKGGMDFSSVIKQYFETQSDKQLLSELNWLIISNGVSDINSREIQFVIGHQKEYSDIISPERVKRKLDYLVKELLNPLVETTDTVNYAINRKLATQIHSYSIDSLIFNYDLKLSEQTKNWNAYKKTSLQSTEIYAWKNHTQLSDIAGVFLKNINDSPAISQAERWAQRSLTLDEEYDTYLLCSRLYQKLNNIPNAIIMAQKAKDLALKFGWEGTESEIILKELNGLTK